MSRKLNKNRIIITLAIILAIATIILYLVNPIFTGKAIDEGEIKIGSILILTGDGASWGIASKNAIDMAVEEINSKGGINEKKLAVDHQDDASDPKKSVSAFNHLKNIKGINIIIGPTWSHTGLAVASAAKGSNTLIISPSLGVKEFNEGSKYIFNTWPHDELLSRNLADLVYKKGHRKVTIIGAEQVWVKDQTKAFKERFEELGGKIILIQEPNPTDTAPYTEALKIKEIENQVDAIVSTTDGMIVGVLVAKRLKELGVKLPIYSISIDQDIINNANGAYEGLEYLTSLTPTKEFKEKYEARYNIAVDIGADSAYDAVILIAEAIKETNSEDPTVLQEYLNKIETYNGASGYLTADGKGGFTKPFLIKKVINGIPVDIET
ncbi:ABC transporter substrate-binding protein [Candidatus Woesearchaeota archaeon]|nr:ABC transporter substrate-binding protein [Candidatus Woesearchaeota archaeon]